MQQKKRNRIIAFSFIYTVCFGSVLLAFPKSTWYSDKTFEGVFLWSAKSNILPVSVKWGEGSEKNTQNTTTPTPKKTIIKTIKPSKKPPVTKKKTCM